MALRRKYWLKNEWYDGSELDELKVKDHSCDFRFEQHSEHLTNLKLSTKKTMSIENFIFLLYILVLASYCGFELIAKVPPTLHTPLMSGSNAISGITIVGAILCVREGDVSKYLGMVALVLATINVVGGYAVTDRMLQMFKKKK